MIKLLQIIFFVLITILSTNCNSMESTPKIEWSKSQILCADWGLQLGTTDIDTLSAIRFKLDFLESEESINSLDFIYSFYFEEALLKLPLRRIGKSQKDGIHFLTMSLDSSLLPKQLFKKDGFDIGCKEIELASILGKGSIIVTWKGDTVIVPKSHDFSFVIGLSSN